MSILTVCLTPTLQKTLRFSSIVPGTVNRTGIHRLDVSGKGINVTRVLTQLGKKATHLTQLGGDLRPLFLSLCKGDGLNVDWVESNSQIRLCYTLLTDGDNNVTELVEESEPVGSGTEDALIKKFDTLISGQTFTYLIISGTKAMGFSDSLIPQLVQKAKNKGLKVILDIRGKDLIDSLQYKPDIVKPNLYEFASTFAADLIRGNIFNVDDAAAMRRIKSISLDMCGKYGCRIILTNGKQKILVTDRNIFFEIEVQPVTTVNSTGCGDAFTAGLAVALDDGADFNAAISEGIRCGTLSVGLIKPGVIC